LNKFWSQKYLKTLFQGKYISFHGKDLRFLHMIFWRFAVQKLAPINKKITFSIFNFWVMGATFL